MRDLGRVVRLQIQRSSLKTGEKPRRVYDPSPILPVGRLAVSSDGALGEAPGGSWIVDVHHRAHPGTKNSDGEHGISLGFTSHYAAMRERFGSRIELGCAGENILVETGRQLTLEDLRTGVAICTPDGVEVSRLTVLDVAHPCRPFTAWALGGLEESHVLKDHLQFLDGGMRGLYCLGVASGTVSVGDRVVLL